jgi:Rps23 Pro-64 3,4-dihydroxylase Tpa1-like proline 4-hydroxylase
MDAVVNVIDNFLDKEIFNEIKLSLLNQNFPWYYNDAKVYQTNSLEDYQFVHIFYQSWREKHSEHFALILPLLEKINPESILRIKANLSMATKENYVYGFHTDNDCLHATTGIYYLNTNDGYTLFDDNQKVDSVENRFVFFNSQIKHSGVSCTKDKYRCVINLNYI